MPQHLQDPNAAPKLHTRRAAVACVQLHADDVAVTGKGFIIPFRFSPQPSCDKTETQGHDTTRRRPRSQQRSRCGTTANPMPFFGRQKCTRGFCVQYPMNCKRSRVYWFFLLSGQTSTLPGRDPASPLTAATSSLSPPTDACNAGVSEAAPQGGSAVGMP